MSWNLVKQTNNKKTFYVYYNTMHKTEVRNWLKRGSDAAATTFSVQTILLILISTSDGMATVLELPNVILLKAFAFILTKVKINEEHYCLGKIKTVYPTGSDFSEALWVNWK